MEENWFQYHRDQQEITIIFKEKAPLKINKKDLEVSGFSGGPGGQNVNKNMTGIRLIYKIPLAYLNSSRKTKEIVVRSMSQRSREHNLKEAFDHLAVKLQNYFYQPEIRKSTKIPASSRKKRFDEKKRRGKIKQERKKVDF